MSLLMQPTEPEIAAIAEFLRVNTLARDKQELTAEQARTLARKVLEQAADARKGPVR